MKKLHVSAISILFATLCLAFTACNQGIIAGNETGTVQVVIGGGGRAVDAAGMPVFDDTNTKITVTDENGNKLAEGTTSVTVNADIGTKITVKAVATTAAGTWRGSVEHTVTAGTNIVAVKLSKTPKNMGNILSSVISQASGGDAKVTFKLASGKELLNDVAIGPNRIIPVIARDGIGRIYVLYDKGDRHFTRFDAEGNEDAGFETAINAVLPSTTGIEAITVDAKTNTIFIVGMDMTGSKHAYAVTEKGHNNFTLSNGFDLTSIGIGNTIQTAAAYNGTLFFTVPSASSGASDMKNKLVAVKAELSGSSLTLSNKIEMTLPKLRAANAFGNYPTNCTGLFADASGVYCLLKEQNLDSGTLYALGQIVRYQYSGSAFTGETKIGPNPKAVGTDGIPFDAQYFSAPVGFIGYDEENIYIADDGYNIEYLNETWRTNGNKNRIAAFNRKTNAITFTDTAATWYEQKPEYKYPNTKILLWEKGDGSTYYGMQYWVADTANTTIPATPADALWFSNQSAVTPTDVFCYDQDGNLYILWKDGSDHKVRRFPVKMDGSYEKAAAQDLNLRTSDTVYAIAVDVSNGRNYLYYYTEIPTPTPTPTPTNKKIERFKWDEVFFLGSKDSAYNISVLPTEKVTALAANKDGVFVGVKETYQEVVSGVNIDKYRLKVKKYKKADGSLDSQITLVNNAVSYTDVTTGDPIADPSPGHDPNQACNQYQETINALQIGNGKLYGISSKLHRKWILYGGGGLTDVFKHSSKLYEIGDTKEALPNEPLVTKEKPAGAKIGYGFYRFIAVKYDEAERIRLIIASDSAWGDGVSSRNGGNSDNIVEFNLKDMVFGEDKKSGGTFSKTFSDSGFFWN